MVDVTIRDYRDWPLDGGTLIVSVPQYGIGSVLLTDHILDLYGMEHVAAIDSDALPPIAMVRRGKARYPARIHADPETRLAILRSEITPATQLARPFARAILQWAKSHRLEQVVALDNIGVDGSESEPPVVHAIASDDAARSRIRAAGLDELDDAVLGGIIASLVLEARFEGVEMIGIVAEVRSPLDEAQSLLSFADALPRLIPHLRLDATRLQAESREVAETIRSLQSEIDRTMRQMQPRPPAEPPPIYG